MGFTIKHTNINVMDIDKSIKFYEEALGLNVERRFDTPSFTIVFMGDGVSGHQIEITHLNDRIEPYDLSDNEIHIAFSTSDIDAAKKRHAEMGVICFENHDMGIYFISDPDGYWLEIIPER